LAREALWPVGSRLEVRQLVEIRPRRIPMVPDNPGTEAFYFLSYVKYRGKMVCSRQLAWKYFDFDRIFPWREVAATQGRWLISQRFDAVWE
jgi:hypothetical protein